MAEVMNNQRKYNTFRQTFPEFVYEKYEYDVQPDGLHIIFCFYANGVGGKNRISFAPSAFIPARPFLNFDQPKPLLDRLVFNIGMIELVSYWKAFCPPLVKVECGSLDENQVAFWKKLYFNGLGEFFYTNGIQASIDDFLDLKSTAVSSKSSIDNSQSQILNSRFSSLDYLVPIGGGKDSVVSLELLRSRHTVVPLVMNPRGATIDCCKAAGFSMDEVLVIRRTIAPTLLDMNAKGALNGHTPFSAMLAFYSLLAAQLSAIPNIALSNENSANESTVVGQNINHQYSKSFEFETDFRDYVAGAIGPQYNYHSFLRPLCELQIAMLFAQNETYFDVFKSCNVGSKQDIWCGHCAKCLFAYIILSPFVAPDRLIRIFGKNMLDDAELKPIFDQLVGMAETKPFECVGTIAEVRTALSMASSRWYGSAAERPVLLRYWIDELCPTIPGEPLSTVDLATVDCHNHYLSSSDFLALKQCIESLA